MSALQSKLGRATWKGVWGWALDTDSPDTRVTVEIVINDQVVGRVLAADPRPNLKIFPDAQRNCGFQFLFPNGLSALSRHVVHARSARDGRELDSSPIVVEANPGFDPALEQTLGNALDVAAERAASQAELDASLQFIVAEMAHLLSARGRLPGGEAGALPPQLAGLHERWVGLLQDSQALAQAFPEPGAMGRVQRRALVVGDCAPVLDDAARLTIAHVESLRRLGFAVDFVAAEFRPPCTAQIAAIEACGAVYVRPPAAATVEELLRRNRGLYETVLLLRVGNFEKYAALAGAYCPLARIVYDVDNLLFLRMLRRAGLQNWPGGQRAGEALRQREMMAAWSAQTVVSASVFEAALIRRAVPQAKVHVVAWPVAPLPVATGFAERSGIAFVGDFQLHADLDAAAWLIEVLMPAVWAIDPSITCLIAGVNMPEGLRTLVQDGVAILDQPAGWSERAVVFERVRLTVAVQRAAAGLPPAVLASLAAGVACVGTAVALEGFELPEALRAGMADDVPALAALVCRLHADASFNAELSEAGLRFVTDSFSEAAVDSRMLAAVGVEVGAAIQAVALADGSAAIG